MLEVKGINQEQSTTMVFITQEKDRECQQKNTPVAATKCLAPALFSEDELHDGTAMCEKSSYNYLGETLIPIIGKCFK